MLLIKEVGCRADEISKTNNLSVIGKFCHLVHSLV